MAISRETFAPDKNYKKIRYHQDRDLLDSELNEQQSIFQHEFKKIADMLFKEGAVISGLGVTQNANVLTIGEGILYIDGHLEIVPGAALSFDPAKTAGIDYVYVELLKYNFSYNQDAALINPATGEPTAEREKWLLSLKDSDTTNDTLPNNVFERKVIPIYKFDREKDLVTATVQEKSNLYISDLLGTLPGNRITVSSITEDQLSFAAAEGLNSLLHNLAERTYDQAGSYLVKGLDSFIADNDGENVEVVTNAGRAYIQGFRLQLDLPTTTLVPISDATKSVRGEQKTYTSGKRRYELNSKPLDESTQVEAIVEIMSNITRGSVGSGEDLLEPNPVVDILEVSQGATIFEKGVDWQQSGNYVDFLGSGIEPGIGTTYTVRWTYTKQMQKDDDYVDGGWFGEDGYPDTGDYYYVVTAFDANGETASSENEVVFRETDENDINKVSWLPVFGANGYRVYRAYDEPQGRKDFLLLKELGSDATFYIDDGVDETTSTNPPENNTSGVVMSPIEIEPADISLINFGRFNAGDEPVEGSNCSIDYDYFLGRKDIIYATTKEIKRLEGSPADFPKLPIVPEGTIGLCSVECPPDSVDMSIRNFGLKRVTMDQIHDIINDVEDLKYNDAQFQMNNDLQNRDAQTKKGIYSDDFSNDAQSDVYHDEWDARIDGVNQFVAPDRSAVSNLLQADHGNSNALFKESLVLLPGTETVLVEQSDWSEDKNINPYAVFEKPDAIIQITPNIGRRGQTGVAVIGSNFTPNTSNISIKCDGQAVGSNISADKSGRVTASFTVPNNARNGDRIVEMTDGTYSAQANIQINDPLVITRIQRVVVNRTIVRTQTIVQPTPPRIVRVPVIRTVWRWQLRNRRRDPLAQTFSFTKNRIISAIGVQFTKKDESIPVTVQIRGVTTGLPNEVVFNEKVISPDEINLETETKIIFDDPFYAEANTSYAVVLLTNSTNYRVRIATLGQMGQKGIITKQTYAQGVLLESSNAETWTPLNGSDLTVKIYGYDFESSGEVYFNPITGIEFSELNLDEYSAIPEGCNMVWEYSLNNGTTWDAIVPAEEENLPNIGNQVLVRVKMFSNAENDSPALNFKDVNLIGYLNNNSGAYITRENELTQGIDSTKIYSQMNIPSGTTIKWLTSNDGGENWEEMTLETTRKIDNTWTEYSYTHDFNDPSGNQVRYKAELNGNNMVYPKIHTLGATLS